MKELKELKELKDIRMKEAEDQYELLKKAGLLTDEEEKGLTHFSMYTSWANFNVIPLFDNTP